MKKMKIILTNLEELDGSFYEKLHQEGYFDHSLFSELILFIDRLNETKISKIKRLRKSTLLWELAYRIQSSIGYHFNVNDLFIISNVDEEKLGEIGQVIAYICKSFTENQQLDMDFIHELTN